MNKGLVYASLLALQFGIQPLLYQRFVAPEIQKFSLIVVTELCKIVIAAVSFAAMPRDDLRALWRDWSLAESLTTVAPPAVLYAIQNILVQLSYSYKINSMMFNLLNQTKTLSAALWIYIIIGKGQSTMQIFALILLLASAVVLNLDAIAASAALEQHDHVIVAESDDGSSNSVVDTLSGLLFAEQNIAVVCVIIASMISGLSAALTQRLLTQKKTNSIFVSAQFGVYGILFLVSKEVFWDQTTAGHSKSSSLLAGWDFWALVPVLTSALGGIVIGLVTQHAGSIVKGFALIVGLLVTGVAQWAIEGVGLKTYDWVALGLVSISIYIHTSFPVDEKVNVSKQKEKTM